MLCINYIVNEITSIIFIKKNFRRRDRNVRKNVPII